MNMETKQAIFARYKREYYKAKRKKVGGRKLLTEIIDTVVDVTSLQRKSVIRKFKHLQMKDPCHQDKRGKAVYYTPDVTFALKEVWQAGGEVCGELLHSVTKEYVDIFMRDKMWDHGKEITSKLLAMSMGTMKNRVGNFSLIKKKCHGLSSTSPSQIKHIIPIFHGEWNAKLPGSGQIDTVVHCGHSLTGDLVFTLNYTDIPLLWRELRAQWSKGQAATQESLACLENELLWNMIELHPDTGSEFVNWHLKGWCDIKEIKMTRSRPNHKNDNMHVEERNGHIVRKWIGYARFDCKEAVSALNNVYAVLNPYLNHFVASRRLLEKYEVDGKWKKRYEKVAKTPYQRVLENEHVSKEIKEKLKAEHEKLNPAIMKKEIDRLKKILYETQKKYGKNQNNPEIQ